MVKNMKKWSILPKVKELNYLEETFFLDQLVLNENCNNEVKKIVQTVFEEVTYCNEFVNVELKINNFDSEEYQLSVTERGIKIEYASSKGLFYALISLKHLRKQFGNILPCIKVKDCPDVKNRGVMFDISRNKVPKLSTLYLLVDMMADLKYNQLQLYIEGLSFEYESFRNYLSDECYITKSEMEQLQTYCEHRFIELIANQNTLGHMTEWLSIDDFKSLARNPEGEMAFGKLEKPGTLDPEKSETLEFIEKLNNDMLSLFKSEYYNVNMDEAFGITEPSLYQEWLLKMYKSSKLRGKRMMMWSDMLISFKDEIKEVPEDIVLLDWGYEDHYPFDTECKKMKQINADLYLCPGTSSWCSISGRTNNMIKNVDKAIDCVHRYDAKGILMTDWGDAGHWQTFPISYPGFAYAAAKSWNKAEVSQDELANYLDLYVFEDECCKMGNLALAIGKTCQFDDFRLLNGSIFHHQFVMGLCSKEDLEEYIKGMKNWMIPYANRFFDDGGEELIRQIEDRKEFDFETVKLYLSDLTEMLRQSDMKRRDASFVITEYEQTLQMLNLATEIRYFIEYEKTLQPENKKEKLELIKKLVEKSEAQFKETWRYRNKESKLEKSTEMYRNIKNQIKSLEE